MILLAVAASLSAPVAIAPDGWFNFRDVPPREATRPGMTSVGYGITVTPQGTAQDCRVESSSGDIPTDRAICAVLLRSARFKPATDDAGQPVYGVYRDVIYWWEGEPVPDRFLPPADIELTVNEAPEGVRLPATVPVSFAVDSSGVPSSCVVEEDGERSPLARTACSQVVKGFTAIPARDGAGNAVPSIQRAEVRFVER